MSIGVKKWISLVQLVRSLQVGDWKKDFLSP